MNPNTIIRTPYHQQPMSLVFKAIKQKVFRQLHCMECGQPFADITDKVVIAYDGATPMERYEPDKMGTVEVHCPRHQCKQYYRLEFAV